MHWFLIVMGSDSDLEIMREAGKALEEFRDRV
jgi:phosphoribosylcarboxyaminoimidazole (NCAIR) mutase